MDTGCRTSFAGHRPFLRIACTVVAALSCAAACIGQSATTSDDDAAAPVRLLGPDDGPADPTPLQVPETLQRIVHRFTFEEAAIRPLAMPINFYRHVAPELGFPPFGDMGPTDAQAHSGDWSFRFALDGGSMAARIPTGVIPAIATGRYIITAHVRTEGLRHSRASIAAWMHDQSGSVIAGSRVETDGVQTHGQWRQIALEVNADRDGVTDLVLELRLAQPRQQPGRLDAAPDETDFTGRAWFDDITIWHAPSISLATDHPVNAFSAGQRPTVRFDIRDLASEPLAAHLKVFDIDGSLVHEAAFNRPGDFGGPRRWTLPSLPAGWYRLALDLEAGELLVGRRWLDLVVLADTQRSIPRDQAEHCFSIRLGADAAAQRSATGAAVQFANAHAVYVPIWPRSSASTTTIDSLHQRVALAAELLQQGPEIVLSLEEVPAALAEAIDVERTQVLTALTADPSQWRPYLDEPMLSLGLEAQRWQVGGVVSASLDDAAMIRAVRDASASLSAFVPDLHLMIEWPVLREAAINDTIPRLLRLPTALRPQQFDQALSRWTPDRGESTNTTVLLEPPATSAYTARQQVLDLSMRVLHAWQAGADEFVIDAPWDADAAAPHPTLPAWRTLADQLTNRRFIGELDEPAAAACWIISDRDARNAALVAWADTRAGEPAHLDMLLADGPVRVIDIFGNVTTVVAENGRHRIPLGETPVFIDGIDPNVALFRSGFAIAPETIPSAHRLHEVELVLRNPWDIGISGTVRVLDDNDWRINPRVSTFSIAPNSEARLPVDMVFDRNVLSGRKTLRAEVTLRSDRQWTFIVRRSFRIGLEQVHVSARWQIESNGTDAGDLVITEYVTNRSDRAITVSAFMHAPGLAPRVRPLGRVDPGATAVQTFRIPGGATALAGQQIRYGVREVDGSTRLNRVLLIPQITPDRAATAPTP